MAVLKKRIPERKCIGCNTSYPKSELIRIVRTPNGEISLDFTGKTAGRGAYLCHKTACFTKARKAKRIQSALNTEIPEEIFDKLLEELDG